MRLFLAGLYTSNFSYTGQVYRRLSDNEKWYRHSVQNYLESYHYVHKQSAVDRMRRDGVRVFLDSGAFSAFTKGSKIDLPKYCDYIQRNADIVEVASVLDAIGDAEGTWRNQEAMEARGVRPLPCFHYGEPEELLDHYVANYEYITLGGMVPISTKQLILWLDRLWGRHLTDLSGRPKIKVHGFGLTSLPLMVRYPWYSVDSSTWVQWAANGMVLLPTVGQVNVSANSSSRKQLGQHLDTMAPSETERLERVFASFGADTERLRHLYFSRWAFNVWSFPYWVKDTDSRHTVFKTTRQELF